MKTSPTKKGKRKKICVCQVSSGLALCADGGALCVCASERASERVHDAVLS